MDTLDLTVVVPAYDEEKNLPVLAGEIRAVVGGLGLDYEVLFVDDGSTDGTPRVLASLAAADPHIRLLRLCENSGQSAAMAAGFRRARGRLVVTLDADLQNDPADVPRMLDALDDDCDVVCGVRQNRQDDWLRRVSSRIANGVRNRVTHESVTDIGCTLRVYRAHLVRELPMFSGMHRFLPTLLRLEGARIKGVPVRHRPRRFGQPKYNIRNRIWRALVDLFAVRWMQSRWIDRRAVEEVGPWMPVTFGSPSDSPVKDSSSHVS